MSFAFKWMKLPVDFFDQPELSRLVMSQGGCDAAVLYLRLLLDTMNSDGLVLTGKNADAELIPLSQRMGVTVDELRQGLKKLKEHDLLHENPMGESYVEVARYVGRAAMNEGGSAYTPPAAAPFTAINRERVEKCRQEAIEVLVRQRLKDAERRGKL